MDKQIGTNSRKWREGFRGGKICSSLYDKVLRKVKTCRGQDTDSKTIKQHFRNRAKNYNSRIRREEQRN